MADFDIFGQREREGWADKAIVDTYVDRFAPITDAVAEQVMHTYVAPGDAVLDLCCGQGTVTAKLSAHAASVHGLDFSPEMIALARDAAPGAEISEGDAMNMPFDAGRFDKVVCNFGMMHIPDQPKALGEIARVLKPGGGFAMSTWMGPPASPAFRAVFGAIKGHADFSSVPPQPDLFAFASSETAKDMLAAAGLEMLAHEVVEERWVLERPEELFEIFLGGTVGARMIITGQTDEVQKRIADAITQTVRETCADGVRFVVPVPVAVIGAQKAA